MISQRLKLCLFIDTVATMVLIRAVSNATKLCTRLCNLCNFTRDYTMFVLGLHILLIQELAVIF